MATKQNRTYQVRSGDNWYNVAERLRTNYRNLVQANPNVRRMVPGQVLRNPTTPNPPPSPTAPPAGYPQRAWSPQQLLGGIQPLQYTGRTNFNLDLSAIQPLRYTGRAAAGATPQPPYRADYYGPRAPVAAAPSSQPLMSAQEFMNVRNTTPLPSSRTMPIPGRQPGSRAAARENVPTITNTWQEYNSEPNRYGYVQQAMSQGKLPLVIRPETAAQMNINDTYLQQLGYTRNNQYGYWVRPMYEQQAGAPVAAAGGTGAGRMRVGGSSYGGGGSYAQYGTQGGTGTGYKNMNPSGFGQNQNYLYAAMPLVSWRI